MTVAGAPEGHAHDGGGTDRRRLVVTLAIALAVMVIEVWGSLVTGSLALLADAMHVLSDAGALGLALAAVWLASRPHTARQTFGWHRAEVLAATANAVVLLAIALFITWHAIERLRESPEVSGEGVIAIAAVAVVANLVMAWVLGHSQSINVRAARLHVLSDLGGSVAALTAGVGITLTGWQPLDPLLSLVIVALIVYGAYRLLREALGILMEQTPRGVSLDAIEAVLRDEPGVLGVHEMHLWTITSGFVAFTAHLQVHPDEDAVEVARRAREHLRARFGIEHATIQPEHPPLVEVEVEGAGEGRRGEGRN